MCKIYIPSGNLHLERQIPFSAQNKMGDCEFVFDENEEYDYFVTIDNVESECKSKVDKKHRLLFLGEPPYVKQYNKKFLHQYGYVYSCQKRIVESGQATRLFPLLPWMLGISLKENSHDSIGNMDYITYDDFKIMNDCEERLNKCCLITSNKKFTKGHRDRVRFADYVLKYHSDIIDVYGNGYKSVPDKFDVLRKYKYAIVIENCRYPDYWTEKIGDCFLAGCYPIYHGCTNIEDYFPNNSFSIIDIRNTKKAINDIKNIIGISRYQTAHENLMEAKNLILDRYNIFSQVAKIVKEIDNSQEKANFIQMPEFIHPMKLSFINKIKQMIAWKLNILI